MLERDISAKLVKLVKEAGGLTYKLDARAQKGAPDRVIVMPRGRVFFVELKTESGRLSALQQIEIEKLLAVGANTRVLYGADAVEGFISGC